MSRIFLYISIILPVFVFSPRGDFFVQKVSAATVTIEGTATVVGQQTFTFGDGGEFLFESDGQSVLFTIPEDFYDEDLQLQVVSNPNTEYVESYPTPSSLTLSERVYYAGFSTLSGTNVSVLDEDVSVVLTYSDEGVSGLISSTLAPYRWTGTEWAPLLGYVLDTNAKTVTFLTTEFGTFSLLAEPVPEPDPEPPSVTPAPPSGGGGLSSGVGTGVDAAPPSPVEQEEPPMSTEPPLEVDGSDGETEPTPATEPILDEGAVRAPLATLFPIAAGLINIRDTVVPFVLEHWGYLMEFSYPLVTLKISEVPSVASVREGFTLQGRTLPDASVRVWLKGAPENESLFERDASNVPNAIAADMEFAERNHHELHYHEATVAADGTFVLEHPPISPKYTGVYTVQVEVLDKEESVITLSERMHLIFQEEFERSFEEDVTRNLLILLSFIIVAGSLWFGWEKILLLLKSFGHRFKK